ncbi:hypothetical protein L6452_25617 [Arctium lappa]|uniref:Uncharacterized protein n=1 Tax=Arctium lappa TaxID=4217 RepID=A0ACB9AAK5_ARCLA|nr:hypothetical protein L6452_25617 [Arctium lappa]
MPIRRGDRWNSKWATALCLRCHRGKVLYGSERGKLSPRFLGPFKVLKRVGLQAYQLELPPELSRIHNTFHVCYLRKCLAVEDSVIPLSELRVDEGNRCVEEPDAILERKSKKLRRKEVTLVKGKEVDVSVYRAHGSCAILLDKRTGRAHGSGCEAVENARAVRHPLWKTHGSCAVLGYVQTLPKYLNS